MKYLFVLSLFLVPNLAKANFGTGLILGTMLSSGPRTTTVEVKDEFAKQVEQIERTLPNRYEAVTQPNYQFSVVPADAQKYLNYFKNGGYQVSYEGGSLFFDLSSRYENYLATQAQRLEDQKAFDQKWESAKPYFKGFGIAALTIIFLVALVKALDDMHRMGILGWFYRTEKKLITKLLKDIESARKK